MAKKLAALPALPAKAPGKAAKAAIPAKPARPANAPLKPDRPSASRKLANPPQIALEPPKADKPARNRKTPVVREPIPLPPPIGNGPKPGSRSVQPLHAKPKAKDLPRRERPPAVLPPPPSRPPVAELIRSDALIPADWREKPCSKVAKLTKTDLEHYRRLLVNKRGQILGDLSSMEDEALRRNAGTEPSNSPIHMAELGSDNFEQELTLGLVATEKDLLEQIDTALLRMYDGLYGVCEATGRPIGKPRLDAKPWARYCIEYVREQERRGRYI